MIVNNKYIQYISLSEICMCVCVKNVQDHPFTTDIVSQARALKVSPAVQPNGAGPVPGPPAKQKLPTMDAKVAQQTDEILNSILPPR